MDWAFIGPQLELELGLVSIRSVGNEQQSAEDTILFQAYCKLILMKWKKVSHFAFNPILILIGIS